MQIQFKQLQQQFKYCNKSLDYERPVLPGPQTQGSNRIEPLLSLPTQNNNLIFQFLAFDCIPRLRRSGLQRKRRFFVVFGVPGASPVNMFRSGWNGGVGTPSTLTPTRGLVFPEFLILVIALRFCEAGYESIVGAGGARLVNYFPSNFI